MKANIQPEYNVIEVTCSTCNNVMELGSTSKDLRIDTCSNCHPFYTGSQQFVQAQGRVERFNRRFAKKADALEEVPANKKAKIEPVAEED